MKLRCLGPGEYESEDGRVQVALDHTYQTECDEPHPVRVRTDTLRLNWTEEGIARIKGRLGAKVSLKRLKSGEVVEYVSWFCEGNEDHFYSMWTVKIDEDWTDDVYETFDAALGAVEKATGEKVTVSRSSR